MRARVLVIEDAEDVADMYCHLLRLKGFECERETDARRGLARATGGGFDLVVLDLMMPGMNGLDVTEAIRGAGVMTPILMVTGHTNDPLLKGSARRAGANRVMEKPVEMAQFLDSVRCLTGEYVRRGEE